MAWWQALGTILLGNLIVLAPILLNSHPGTKYGIPFPVFARAAYGTVGANLPALMRALIACGWFGINAWIGGARAADVLRLALARLGDAARHRLSSGLPDHAVDLVPAVLGPQHPRSSSGAWTVLRRVERFAAPLRARDDRDPRRLGDLDAPAASARSSRAASFDSATRNDVLARCSSRADRRRSGSGRRCRSTCPTSRGSAAVAARAGDRPGRRAAVDDDGVRGDGHRDHVGDRGDLRQGRSAIRSSSAARSTSRLIVGIAMFTVVIATLAVNIAANVVSPANDFANAFPKQDRLQARRPDHRRARHRDDAVGAARRTATATSTAGSAATAARSARSRAC